MAAAVSGGEVSAYCLDSDRLGNPARGAIDRVCDLRCACCGGVPGKGNVPQAASSHITGVDGAEREYAAVLDDLAGRPAKGRYVSRGRRAWASDVARARYGAGEDIPVRAVALEGG